jgi:vitamin B12 transporter
MKNNLSIVIIFIFCFLSLSVSFIPESSAQSENEMRILRMYFDEKDLVETPTRNPKPVSRVAENVTIITSDEIGEMNAHTLADVLYNIPGVQIDLRGGPGSIATARVQGSEFRHAIVMIDNITINNLSDNFADIAAIPAQIIKRVEIIKGPASSSWGSSLGGIINVITKAGPASSGLGGTLSASYGERKTGDYRTDVYGKTERLSYYLYGGNIVSNGFSPGTRIYSNNLYSRFRWNLSPKADAVFTFGYNKGSRGEGEFSAFDLSFGNRFEYLLSTLTLNYYLSDTTDLSASVRTSRRDADHFMSSLSTDDKLISNFDDTNNGGTLKLSWKSSVHDLVSGLDYDHGTLESNVITGEKQHLKRWAVFINDTVVLDKFVFTPGLRYDDTNTSGSFISPSLGVTYNFSNKTLIRVFAAKGFNTPPLSASFGTGGFSLPNPDLKMEKVFSVQAGIESAALKYFWLKATIFRHDLRDAIFNQALSDETFITINQGSHRRQGAEIEFKTVQFRNISLSGGATLVDATDRDSGETLKNLPKYTYDIGIHYNDKRSFSALLKGHYVWWNSDSDLRGRYTAMIWDLSLTRKLPFYDKKNAEFFLNVHNIFDGSQYVQYFFKNPGRWVEAGLRLKF